MTSRLVKCIFVISYFTQSLLQFGTIIFHMKQDFA